MNDVVDGITLTSTAEASLSPAVVDHVSTILMQQDNQNLCQGWQMIFLNLDTDRRSSILQAFGYHEPDPTFESQFTSFIQTLLSAVWPRDQQAASTLARTLSASDPTAANAQPQVQTRLDVILLNDAIINARILSKRNPEVPQTYVDKYGLPAEGNSGTEGQDYFYYDTDEATCKLECLRSLLGNDIVRWNERDWNDGLYGDPYDLSISGTHTGWVVQQKKRVLQQPRGSRGRLPGSYNEVYQKEDLLGANKNPRNLEDQTTAVNQIEHISSSIVQYPLPHFDQTVPMQQGFSFKDSSLLNTLGTQAQPQHVDTQSPGFSSVSHLSPTQAQPFRTDGTMLPHGPVELSGRDRQLLESYRLVFERREEEFGAHRLRQAQGKKIIRTRSEKDLMRNQQSEMR